MATLQERIFADLKAAMKAQDKAKVGVLRMLRSELKNAEIAAGHPLAEEEVLKVLARAVKQRREAAEQYRRAGEEARAAAEEAEIAVIEPYLPQQLSDAELEALVEEVLAALPEQDRSNLGKVMKAVMPKVAGRADGRRVNELVRRRLG
ncbi:MAG: GatB/YqeY domain-containing protein [Nitrospirae bacterium]|nr:MAG: GatB/YqeY domain-containing protein [Nitrospirota bacterium]